MRKVMRVVGVVLGLTGVVWILQGVGLLPGSFMTGQIEWAIIGAVALILGLILALSPGISSPDEGADQDPDIEADSA